VTLAIRTCPSNTEPAAPQTVTEAEDAPPGSGEDPGDSLVLGAGAVLVPGFWLSPTRRSNSSIWLRSVIAFALFALHPPIIETMRTRAVALPD
jgi:hypothetical protein